MGLYTSTPGFRMADWGLKRARLAEYKGLVFATFDEEAPTLDDWLGDFRWYLDDILDAEEGGTEFLPGGATRSVIGCNWKFPADNFVGDIYHALWTHLGGSEPTLGRHGGVQVENAGSYQVSVNGHGWEFNDGFLGNAATMGDRELLRYMRSRQAAIRRACLLPSVRPRTSRRTDPRAQRAIWRIEHLGREVPDRRRVRRMTRFPTRAISTSAACLRGG